MPGYRATQIRAPANETEFEKNCVVLFRELLNDPNTKRVGTKGQKQHGLDVVGCRDRDPKKIVGIQCKLKSGRSRLTKTEAKGEIKRALGYRPRISEYFIVTTSKDDIALLQLAQHEMQKQEAAGRRIHIEIWGWDTLQEKINQSESAKNAFDPGFSPSIAAQDRKLDAIIAAQKQQPTNKQLADLAKSIEECGSKDAARIPAVFAERELKEALSRVLRRRGFAKSKTPEELAALANRAIDGDLSLGPTAIRAEICDRAARANADAKSLESANRFRKSAADLDPSRDLFIAAALVHEAEGDPDATLRELKKRIDPDTRSALMNTLIRQKGRSAALAWARAERLEPGDFTPPGVMNLVLQEIEEGEFDRALDHTLAVPDVYLDQCPAIRLLRAQLTLASILPKDQKAAPFQGLPLNPRVLQLASGTKAKESIRAAASDLRALIALLPELELDYLASFLTEFELWLRLEDDDTRDAAREQVAKEIADPDKTLQRVRLALAYKIPFNQEALQRHLISRKDIGGWTQDERFAAFLLAYHSEDAKKISDFFDKHHDDLFAQSDLGQAALAGIEIELLARTGRFEEAHAHIALHTGPHLTSDQARDIEEMVAHIQKDDEVESLRQRYADTNNLGELRLLVGGLRARRDIKQLVVYAPVLARETKTVEDFDVAIRALFQNDQLSDVLGLMDELPELLELDEEYSSIKGWALFRLGRVMEARPIARTLMTRRGSANDRELNINTAIESGDWGNLQALLAQEANRADTIPAGDLIRLAHLALEVDSPYIDQFRDAALRKAPDDPQVNLSAYMLATERGEEYRAGQAGEWFQKAIKLSGPDGPVRSVSMREMIDLASGWNERTEKIDKMLRQAEAPLFMVARALRSQLLNLILGQALRNSDASDSRLRFPVFAFFGAHPWQRLIKASPVALDISCIITLDYLGLLQSVIDHFDHVFIAPSTLSMLFIERQFLRVHQPSELAKAERIRALIGSGGLKVIAEQIEPPAAESKEIGIDLAQLLSLAKRDNGLVVRSAPVVKKGSYLEEHADMGGHAAELTDTLSVLAFLSQTGKIDAETKQGAESYLRQVDKGWTGSPPITSGSKLFLDDLTVTYLDHVGVLEALLRSVAAVFVHPDVDARARQTISYGKQTDELLGAIGRIRGTLNAALESGKVRFSARRMKEEPEHDDSDASIAWPSLDIMSNLSGIEFVCADDRCLNKLATWSDGAGHSAKAGTTLEILEELKDAAKLSEEALWRARHKLRASGYYAMPLRTGEILHHLAKAPVEGKEIRETPELRAVRESIALARINNVFIRPETPWLNSITFEFIKALRHVWAHSVAGDASEAQSNWLLSVLPDPLEWCLEPEHETVWAAARQTAIGQTGLLLIFVDGNREQRQRFFAWLNEAFIKRFRQERPDLWSEVIPFLKSYLVRLMEPDDET